MITGVSIIDKAINEAGISNTRFGSTNYSQIPGIIISRANSGQIRAEIGFHNNEGFMGTTHPDIKSQHLDMNLNGSSAIIYSNRRGISHSLIKKNCFNHWYRSTDWKSKLNLGISMSVDSFNPNNLGKSNVVLW